MRFDDCRTEWRITDIENKLRNKADDYQLDQTNSDVYRMEHSMREISSLVDGLRIELKTYQDKVENLEQELRNLQQ